MVGVNVRFSTKGTRYYGILLHFLTHRRSLVYVTCNRSRLVRSVMITKEQALDYSITHFHYTGDGACSRTIGPRGAITTKITKVRRNGTVQTWKTRPNDWSMPVKYGIRARDQFRITNESAQNFHPETECPLNV